MNSTSKDAIDWTASEDGSGRAVSSNTIQLDDHSTTVIDTGGSGLPMVLLHGVGFDCWMWKLVLPYLPADRRIVTYDLRGHGTARPVKFAVMIMLQRIESRKSLAIDRSTRRL